MFYRMRSPERWDKPDLEIFQVEEQMTRGIGIRERKEGKNNARKWNVYSYDTLPIVGGQKYIYRTIFWRRREFYYYYFFYKIMLMIRCFTYVKYIYIYISCKYIIHLFESLISVIRFDSENKVWQRPPYRIWSRTRTELRETTTRFFFGIAPRNDKRGMNWWIEGQCKKAKATTNVLRIPLSACIAR